MRMSNATIGSFTAGEWNKIQSDARTYQQLRKEYGSLKEAQRRGVDTKNTKSGLSLSNAYNTTRVMSGNRQYKSNLSKKTGLPLEGKKTSYNKLSTLSVKVGKGSKVQNTQAAGGAKAIKNLKPSTTKNIRSQQNAAKALAKNYKPSTTSGSKSSKTSSTKKTTTSNGRKYGKGIGKSNTRTYKGVDLKKSAAEKRAKKTKQQREKIRKRLQGRYKW